MVAFQCLLLEINLLILYPNALSKNKSDNAYERAIYFFIFLLSGGEETEYDIRNDPIRIEEREKDLVIPRGIKCHVYNCVYHI